MPTDEPTLAPHAVREDVLDDAIRRACQTIAPVWPLESFVAVNPYLGLVDRPFDAVADRLARTAGARTTMPAAFYLEAVDRGRITVADLAAALDAADDPPAATVEAFLDRVRTAPDADPAATVPTVADVASACTGHDWDRLATDRVSAWAGAYFDRGQALWRSADPDQPLFAAWKAEAGVDHTPEVMGLAGFRDVVAALPDDPRAAAYDALARLDVPAAGLDRYLHRVLMRAGGWAAYAGRIVWDARLYDGRADDTLLQFLAVLLGWEVALFETIQDPAFPGAWAAANEDLATEPAPPWRAALERQLILQDAFDRAAQRRLVERVNARPAASANGQRPDVQAVFCIDVRSEVFRRHLEAAAPTVDTMGFAGFFGFPIEYVPVGHETGGAQCPVLLTPSHTILETVPAPDQHARAVEQRRLSHHVKRAWNAFKMGAISCFSFVGPVGLAYLPKMVTDTLGWTRPVPDPDTNGLDQVAAAQKGPRLAPDEHAGHAVGMPLDDRVEVAEGALRAMSLTDGFAPLVLITGHGATTVNNPYDTGLDCGACGGRAGEANARVAAAVLNDPAVRAALAERGIRIPDDTVFLAGEHDTTTDEVAIFNRDAVPARHHELLAELDGGLDEAGRRTRAERAERFHLPAQASIDEAVIGRSTDWAQVRPEWGLAGCMAFIVAPRHRTEGLDLGGRSFLHDYDWRQDEDFGVLELIMTAPMVVT
ncbi:MAG: DUF2309 family protein, partial [Bacteroidetes bacterium]|nr:DUF2309 family protein [Bacteroidota bacterium]